MGQQAFWALTCVEKVTCDLLKLKHRKSSYSCLRKEDWFLFGKRIKSKTRCLNTEYNPFRCLQSCPIKVSLAFFIIYFSYCWKTATTFSLFIIDPSMWQPLKSNFKCLIHNGTWVLKLCSDTIGSLQRWLRAFFRSERRLFHHISQTISVMHYLLRHTYIIYSDTLTQFHKVNYRRMDADRCWGQLCWEGSRVRVHVVAATPPPLRSPY